VTTNLGQGWTIERVRTHSGDANAEELSLVRDANHDDNWYMGELADDGTVICWSAYASDLGEAINAL